MDLKGRLTKIDRSYLKGDVLYYYDSMNRLQSKEYDYFYSTPKLYSIDYEYAGDATGKTTNRVKKETSKYNGMIHDSFEYEYYPDGNLSKVYLGTNLKKEYTYDKYSRLQTENNLQEGVTRTYTYDKNGNIASILETTSANPQGITKSYTYSGDNKLTSYNGTTITYDAGGNATSYNGKELSWSYNRLESVDDTTMEYGYNGLRMRKGNRYFYWLGDTLKTERWTENNMEKSIYYVYDEQGICGFNYYGTEYYLRRNIFGDVIAIYDTNGNLQATYDYDAWGNHTVTNYTSDNVGDINPIRYRGYYWDADFGLYYCKSRYYSPEWRRFISPDSIEYLDYETINGLNLYAYCGNNPIMNVDPSGHSLLAIFAILAATTITSSSYSLFLFMISIASCRIFCSSCCLN